MPLPHAVAVSKSEYPFVIEYRHLLRAMLLQVLFSIHSERQLMEQTQYNLLFHWFIGLSMGDSVWVPTVFWAGHKSFVRKDGKDDDDGGDFRGKSCSNETHESSTDPDSRLFRKGKTACELRFLGHTLMENRNGLIVNAHSSTSHPFRP